MLMKIIMSSLCIGLLTWWNAAKTGFERLLVLILFITVVLPLSVNWLLNWLRFKSKPNDFKNSSNKFGKDTMSNTNFKTEFSPTIPSQKPKSSKTNPSEHYPVLKEMIVNASKQRKLSRQSILNFKVELNYRLGEHAFVYSNFKFENDLHEIYVKLKSSKLLDKDYIYLIKILNEMVGETQQETKDIDIEDIPW